MSTQAVGFNNASLAIPNSHTILPKYRLLEAINLLIEIDDLSLFPKNTNLDSIRKSIGKLSLIEGSHFEYAKLAKKVYHLSSLTQLKKAGQSLPNDPEIKAGKIIETLMTDLVKTYLSEKRYSAAKIVFENAPLIIQPEMAESLIEFQFGNVRLTKSELFLTQLKKTLLNTIKVLTVNTSMSQLDYLIKNLQLNSNSTSKEIAICTKSEKELETHFVALLGFKAYIKELKTNEQEIPTYMTLVAEVHTLVMNIALAKWRNIHFEANYTASFEYIQGQALGQHFLPVVDFFLMQSQYEKAAALLEVSPIDQIDEIVMKLVQFQLKLNSPQSKEEINRILNTKYLNPVIKKTLQEL